MSDILMVAEIKKGCEYPYGHHRTIFLPKNQFSQSENEALVRAHDQTLWCDDTFKSHYKYSQVIEQATYVCVVVDPDGQYLGSALVIATGEKWTIEYVMAIPTRRENGVGSALMGRIMNEAEKHGARWGILNCDPTGDKLPRFYAKFGFKKVGE